MVVNERKSKTMQKYLGVIFSNLCYFSFHGNYRNIALSGPYFSNEPSPSDVFVNVILLFSGCSGL